MSNICITYAVHVDHIKTGLGCITNKTGWGEGEWGLGKPLKVAKWPYKFFIFFASPIVCTINTSLLPNFPYKLSYSRILNENEADISQLYNCNGVITCFQLCVNTPKSFSVAGFCCLLAL